MRFYKLCGRMITGTEANGEDASENNTAPKIRTRTEEFNTLKEKLSCTVTNVNDGYVTLCLISAENAVQSDSVTEYTAFIGMNAESFTHTEITLSDTRSLLYEAMNNGYIYDDDDFLKKFSIDNVGSNHCYSLEFGESFTATDTNRKALTSSAKKYAMNETLLPELKRIYSGKKHRTVMGHPVHYVLEADDRDTRREVYKILLDALYTNGRITIPRYLFFDLEQGDRYSRAPFETLYKLSDGGSVVIRYVSDSACDEKDATENRKTIEALCEVIKRHKNKVLSILCFPVGCERVKEMFYKCLGEMSFIEIKEDRVFGDEARTYLSRLAANHRVKPDTSLLDSVSDSRGYVANELNVIFERWYSEKLKTTVYPQYRNVSSAQLELTGNSPQGSAYVELMEMAGLTEAKQMINKALNYYKMQKLYKEHGIKNEKLAMHMCFTGNPGTAKTTVARLFAEIMRDNGLLSSGHLVEVGRGDLVGKYTGWTAQTVSAKFKEAMGGVLFIDEAYSLLDDRDGSYGDEAINAIVQEMENNRSNMVVILAGYPGKMDELIKKNSGLRSRIAFHVPFSDYTADELCDIAELMLRKNGMRFSDSAASRLKSVFNNAREDSDFGNGRYVRNLLEQAKMNQASRLLTKDYGCITAEEVATITAEDIEFPTLKRAKTPRIGFCDFDVAV